MKAKTFRSARAALEKVHRNGKFPFTPLGDMLLLHGLISPPSGTQNTSRLTTAGVRFLVKLNLRWRLRGRTALRPWGRGDSE